MYPTPAPIGPIVTKLGESYERSRAASWKLDGLLSELLNRQAALVREVGLARGFLESREEFDEALEALQRDTNGQLLSRYGQILSRLACEVLQEDIVIALTLTTERGLPALNIVSMGPNGSEIDIFDGMGGSLTNIICLGLRLIAVARIPGMRRFICLDEVDCWVRPGRVARFYDAVKQLANHGGVQTIVIAHHEVGQFTQGTNILQVRGRPRSGLHVEASAPGGWKDDETPGIRSVRLVNVAGYIDSTLELSPGVSAIIGENNVGKSQAISALRAVFYNRVSDNLIRHGEKRCEVHITFEKGVVLSWSREPARRTSVNEWILRDAQGNVMTIDGAICHAGKRKKDAGQDSNGVPEWVGKVSGIFMHDDLDIQTTHQKRPLFLLERPATQRADILNIGRESAYCTAMVALHKANCQTSAQTIKRGERELGELLPRIQSIQDALGAIKADLGELGEAHESILSSARLTSRLRESLGHLDTLRHESAYLTSLKDCFTGLPDAGLTEILSQNVRETAQLSRLVTRQAGLMRKTRDLEAAVEILSSLPEAPTVSDTAPLRAALAQKTRLEAEETTLASAIRIYADIPQAPAVEDLTNIKKGLNKKEGIQKDIAALSSRIDILSSVPDVPELTMTDGLRAGLSRLDAARVQNEAAERELSGVRREIEGAHAQMRGLLEQVGFSCPMCGSGLAHDHPMVSEVA